MEILLLIITGLMWIFVAIAVLGMILQVTLLSGGAAAYGQGCLISFASLLVVAVLALIRMALV